MGGVSRTRVPVSAIFENLKASPIEEIPENFHVTREQVQAVLDFAARPGRKIAFPARLAYARFMDLLSQDEIVRLSPTERLALIAQLWDSLEDHQLPLTNAQQAELQRRLDTLDHDRTNGVTWASLKHELERRCP